MLSDPARKFLSYLRQAERDAKAEERRLRRIEENCVRIRREEIRLVVNNRITRVRDVF